MNEINVDIKILDNRLINNLPKYATFGSAAVDLYACVNEPITLKVGETQLINSGIAIHLNSNEYAAIILPRSGLGHKHGVVLGNLTGLIDSDYQGEIKISLWNRSGVDFVINPMERIAQMMIIPVIKAKWNVVSDFAKSERGSGGFGSTGV